MSLVKQIRVQTITATRANLFIKKHHYSGKVVPNSQVHFGAFLNGQLHGVLQFGPSMVKEKTMGLVRGTGWNEFLELNRMAFDEHLPKNSESRCIGICLRMLKKAAPHIKWVISFADGTQCGDGIIYRASNFLLTNIKPNNSLLRLPTGEIVAKMTYTKGAHILKQAGKAAVPVGSVALPGFQLRYVYFYNPADKVNLTVPVIPFSEIARRGATMYKGMRGQGSSNPVAFQDTKGGAIPTPAHQSLI